MKYMGSKNRIAKFILPIILKDRKSDQYMVDLFCGGANLIDKVDGNRIANDTHPELIAMFQAVQKGWIPPDVITEEMYQDIKITPKDYNMALVGFTGFGASYSGKWWGGYARGNSNKGLPRNYAAESKRNLLKQSPNIKTVKFYNLDYRDVPLPPNSIIYCDPPYKGTTSYKTGKFDYDVFWQWCRDKVNEGHTVFISEYNAPDDFTSVWQKEIVSSLTKDTGSKKGVERLFIYKGETKWTNKTI